MSTTISVNGTTYPYPTQGDSNWASQLVNVTQALATTTLQKAGGSFTVTADVDFGSTAGLKSQYLKSRSANIAQSGLLRLAHADAGATWRNNANTADLALTVDTNDKLNFNGQVVAYSGLISNADVAGAAAIAYSKLNLAASIVDSDISASAAIARSKVAAGTANYVLINDGSGNLSSEAHLAPSRGGTGLAALGSANQILGVTTDGLSAEYKTVTGTTNQVTVTPGVGTITLSLPQSINTGASPTFAGLTVGSLAGVVKATAGSLAASAVVNADISSSAAIALSKLAALTVSKALVSDASGVVSASTVTSTELGYVSGVTSAIQTQLNGKQASSTLLTNFAGTADGSAGQVLSTNGASSGYTWVSPFTNPMTTLGDTVYGGASGASTKLAGNTSATKQFLTQTGTGTASAAPIWAGVTSKDVAGRTDASSITAGYIGEKVSASWVDYTPTGSLADVASISLTAGCWRIRYDVSVGVQTPTVAGSSNKIQVVITDGSNIQVGNSSRFLYAKTPAAALMEVDGVLSAEEVVNINATTTYKIRSAYSASTGTPLATLFGSANSNGFQGCFFAIRIA